MNNNFESVAQCETVLGSHAFIDNMLQRAFEDRSYKDLRNLWWVSLSLFIYTSLLLTILLVLLRKDELASKGKSMCMFHRSI